MHLEAGVILTRLATNQLPLGEETSRLPNGHGWKGKGSPFLPTFRSLALAKLSLKLARAPVKARTNPGQRCATLLTERVGSKQPLSSACREQSISNETWQKRLVSCLLHVRIPFKNLTNLGVVGCREPLSPGRSLFSFCTLAHFFNDLLSACRWVGVDQLRLWGQTTGSQRRKRSPVVCLSRHPAIHLIGKSAE